MVLTSLTSIISIIFTLILPWRWNLWKKLSYVIFFPSRKVLKIYRHIEKIDNKLYKLTFNLLGIFVSEMVIFSASIAASVLFYKYYLPHDAVKYPVHFIYKKCDSSVLSCSHPMLSVDFDHFEWLFTLSSGQKYNFYLDLTLPDSLSNHEAGTFNIFSMLINKFGEPVHTSQKSVMLRFRSSLYSWLSTLVNFPFIYLGFCTEDQLLTTRIFDNYQHIADPADAAQELSITLQSNHINVYEAYLRIEADFIGLRYYMNYYPTLSFISFLTFFFIAFSILALIIYYQFIKRRYSIIEQVSENVQGTRSTKDEDLKSQDESYSHRASQDESSLFMFPNESDPERNSSSDIETISEGSLTETGAPSSLKFANNKGIEELAGTDRFFGEMLNSRSVKDSCMELEKSAEEDTKDTVFLHTESSKLMEGSCSEDDCEIVSVLETGKVSEASELS